jgi:heterotetrameric sarcosine oxidase gamma subunit
MSQNYSANSAPVGATSAHWDLLEAGAKMATLDGWAVPTRFAGPDSELPAARERVGMAEHGHVTKLRLQGPGVPDALAKLGNVPAIGTVTGATVSSSRSGVDVQIARLAATEAWLTASAGDHDGLLTTVEPLLQDGSVFDLTSSFSGVQLVGPHAASVVASLTDLDLRQSNMPDLACAQTTLAEVYGLIVRADIWGLLSYRLYFGREYGMYVWESLIEAGEAYGMALIGSEALSALTAAAPLPPEGGGP